MEVCKMDTMVPGQLHGRLGPDLQLLNPSVCLGAVCMPPAALSTAAALAINTACLLHAETTADALAKLEAASNRLTIHEPIRAPPLTFSWGPLDGCQVKKFGLPFKAWACCFTRSRSRSQLSVRPNMTSSASPDTRRGTAACVPGHSPVSSPCSVATVRL